MVMVAKCLIERDGFVQASRLERFLIINGVGTGMGAGTGGNHLAVNDVKIPPELIIHAGIAAVAQRDHEIKGIFLVQGICRLNGSIKDLGGVQHDP